MFEKGVPIWRSGMQGATPPSRECIIWLSRTCIMPGEHLYLLYALKDGTVVFMTCSKEYLGSDHGQVEIALKRARMK